MAFNTNWNVEKYKCEHESDEHWQLRRRFIETHKNNYPEDKLVCLARVFFNVEFLGCRYPEKTMKLIEDLSREVAADHREKQKNKLKRTFVQASDAAEAKAKRSTVEPPNKVAKESLEAPPKGFQYSCFVHAELVKPDPIVDTGDFPGFIIYENCNSLGQIEACPINILTMSSNKNKQWNSIVFDFPSEKNKPNQAERVCEIKLNDKLLSSASGGSVKEARMKAAIEGLNILRKTCYTIQAKRAFFSESPSISKDGAVKETESRLPQDNVGSKIMQRMGWTGSGLGKKQQGIQDPIKAAPQIMQRSGFGRINEREFQERFRKVFKDYIASDSDKDLVFAPDFSSAERKVLHQLNDPTEGKDLFDIDYDEESSPEMSKQNIDEEDSPDNNQCIVCHKLSACTGQESDDDVYDFMWGTTVDSTGLMPAERSTDYNIRDLFDLPSENSQTYQTKGLYSSKQGSDILNDQDVSSIPSKSSPANENNGIYFVLPDGSVLNISLDYIKSNQVLNKLTFQSGWELIPGMKIYIAENDMNSIPGLKESLLNSPKSKLSVDNTDVIDMDLSDISPENSQDNPPNEPEGLYSSKQIEVSNILYGQEFSSQNSQSSLGNENTGMHYVLPDGSVLNISVDYVKSNQVLNKLTFLSGQKLIPGMKINITENDMNFIPGLKENLLNSNSISSWNKKANNLRDEKTLTTSIEGNMLQKLKIFLPDGSYKRVDLEKIQKNSELTKFTNYLPGKNANELENHVTMNDLRSNKAIRELFSDFFVTCKPLETQQHETINHNPNILGSQGTNTTSFSATSFNRDDSQGMDREYVEELGDIKETAGKIDDNVCANKIETLTPSVILLDNNKRNQRDMRHGNITPDINNKIFGNEPNKKVGVGEFCMPESKRIRFFLPDGSVKRLHVQTILDHTALSEHVHKSRYITDEDLNTNQALRQHFSEYLQKKIASSKEQNPCKTIPGFHKYNTRTSSNNLIQSEPRSESSRKFNDPSNLAQKDVYKVKSQEHSHNFDTGTSSKLLDKSKPICKNPKMRIFLPDGSFKRLPIRVIFQHKALHEHFQKSRYITDEDFKTNPALREYFSDYIALSSNKANPSKQSLNVPNSNTGTSSKHLMQSVPRIESSRKFNDPSNSAQTDIYPVQSQEHPRVLNAPLNPKQKEINLVKCQEHITSKSKEPTEGTTEVGVNYDKKINSNLCFNSNIYHKDSLFGDNVNISLSTKPKRGKRTLHRRMKIYLPDGSFKRFHCSVIENNKSLQHLKIQHKITDEDLKKNKALRNLFPDYCKSSGILNSVVQSNLIMLSGDSEDVQMHSSKLSNSKDGRNKKLSIVEKWNQFKALVNAEKGSFGKNKSLHTNFEGPETTSDLRPQSYFKDANVDGSLRMQENEEARTTIDESVNLQISAKEPESSFGKTESLQILQEEQGVGSLEEHINSSTITTIHSSESVNLR